MAVSRSPGYPAMSLPEAIDLVGKLHAASRTNPTDRESAAKDIGYSGLTGSSAKALADLAHYGLTEKAGKGGLRVSQRAVDILYPESEAGKLAALQDAAASPALFAALNSHFHDGAPSQNSLNAYLMRQGFVSTAIPPVIKSYTDTNRFLQQHGATESHGLPALPAPESPDHEQSRKPIMIKPEDITVLERPAPPQPPAARLNKIDMNIQGGTTVHINALLDHKGLLELEQKLIALKMLLTPTTEANDTGDDD
jgi:hypothetical protein